MTDLGSHSDFQKDSLELRIVGLLTATQRAPYWDTTAHKQDLRVFGKELWVIRMTSPVSHVWLDDF